eukprot:1161429-Pelagomonas_calceolata.AAC.5
MGESQVRLTVEGKQEHDTGREAKVQRTHTRTPRVGQSHMCMRRTFPMFPCKKAEMHGMHAWDWPTLHILGT